MVYAVADLAPLVKARVLDDNRGINTMHEEWWDFEYDSWKDRLGEMGFTSPDIAFSGFSCQGDGACFTSPYVDIEKFIKTQGLWAEYRLVLLAIDLGYSVGAKVRSLDSRYCHQYTVTADVEDFITCEPQLLYDRVGGLLNDLEGRITDVVRSLSAQIYKDLEAEYDGLQSDEAVEEAMHSLGYMFTEDGEREEE